MRPRRSALLALLPALGAGAAEACTEIRFAPGGTSTEIRGVAPPEDVVCYTLETSDGQTARVTLLGARNTGFSVIGVADMQDELSFTTEAGTYQIVVAQVQRSIAPEPFVLRVTVDP